MRLTEETFATAFNCMDGRCQDTVSAFVRAKWGVDWVDAITEPGIDGILAGKHPLAEQPGNILEWIRRKAEVSARGHGSVHAVVVGHTKCAGNNVSDEEHMEDIRAAAEMVRSWGLFDEVICLLVTTNHQGWQVLPLEETRTRSAMAA
jgi:2-keto-3-deoxy-L-rhamnonate aldolase RhmA